MRRLVLDPIGWPLDLLDCPRGLFLWKKTVCFKTGYSTEYGCEAKCETGETFHGGVSTKEERGKLQVQPLEARWEEYSE